MQSIKDIFTPLYTKRQSVKSTTDYNPTNDGIIIIKIGIQSGLGLAVEGKPRTINSAESGAAT